MPEKNETAFYLCGKYKGLSLELMSIGKTVEFQNGFYETSDPDVQKALEESEYFKRSKIVKTEERPKIPGTEMVRGIVTTADMADVEEKSKGKKGK